MFDLNLHYMKHLVMSTFCVHSLLQLLEQPYPLTVNMPRKQVHSTLLLLEQHHNHSVLI